MTTKFVKTATITAAIAFIALLLAYPAISAAQTSTSSNSSSATATSTTCMPSGQWPMGQGGWGMTGVPGFGQFQTRADVSVGQEITFTSTSGQYLVVGTSTTNGTASGSLVFTVTGNLTEGYTLTYSGSVSIGSTTYTVSGSGQLDPSAASVSGQGTTTPTGTFILQGMARGSFVGTTATLSLDLQAGSTEYIVSLNGTI